MNRVGTLLVVFLAVPLAGAVGQLPHFVHVPLRPSNAPASVIRRGYPLARLPAGVDSMRLRPGDYFILRTAPGVRRIESAGAVSFEIPLLFSGLDAAGSALDARPNVEVEGGGLRYVPGRGDFAGSIMLGLLSVSAPASIQRLGRKVNVLITATADSLDSAQVTLDHTNLPFKRIRMVVLSAPPDTVLVHIRTDLDTGIVTIPVPVLRPTLKVSASPRRIAGFGLEEATLAIETQAIGRPDTLVVTVTASRGKMDSTQVVLSRAGTATSSIRSRGLGRDTVTAVSQPLLPGTDFVDYVFPWGFLIAAIIGGIVGGLIHEAQAKRSGRRRSRLRVFVAGVGVATLVGVVAAAAYALGINWLDIPPGKTAGEALVFVTAALGAIRGVPAMTRLMPQPEPPAGGPSA
jgi:hypothetical protein